MECAKSAPKCNRGPHFGHQISRVGVGRIADICGEKLFSSTDGNDSICPIITIGHIKGHILKTGQMCGSGGHRMIPPNKKIERSST